MTSSSSIAQQQQHTLVLVISIALCTYIVLGTLQKHSVPRIAVGSSRQPLLEEGARLPSYFKWKEGLLGPTRDQHHCSSCWAFALTSTFADTLNLMSGGGWKHGFLSPQYLMSCTQGINFGCAVGASPEAVYSAPEVADAGIPLESDFPYVGTDNVPCPVTLPATAVRVRTVKGSGVDLCFDPQLALPGFKQRTINKNIANMKTALINYGPIVGTLRITQDLIDYNAAQHGVFPDSTGRVLGYHAISIIGWCDQGVNTDEPLFKNAAYWIIRNSYGAQWGLPRASNIQSNFAYIAMGVNANDIESRASICRLHIPLELQAACSTHDIATSAYTSYTDYVLDPERQYYMDAIQNAHDQGQ